jgi:nicotinamidase-related amidase
MTECTYDRSRTALLLVDPYREFLSEGGKIWPQVREVLESVDTVRHLLELHAAVRSAGVPVFIAPHRRYRPGDFAGWLHVNRPHRAVRDGRLYEAGTFGGEWYPQLAPGPEDVVASEHWGGSGFAHTDLDQQLRQHGVDSLILAGMSAPGCVEGTGRFAMELGYNITLVKDATAAFSREHMHAAVELNAPLWANAVLPTDEVVAALAQLDPVSA